MVQKKLFKRADSTSLQSLVSKILVLPTTSKVKSTTEKLCKIYKEKDNGK